MTFNFGSFIREKQAHYFKFIVVILLFLLLAFDQDLAMIYILIMLGDYIWYQSDNFISFPISNPSTGDLKVYIESLIGLGFFLVISTVLVSVFSPQSIANTGIVGTTQSIFHLLATSTPILKGSKLLTLLGWGVVVPLIETSFWNGRLMEGLAAYAEEIVGKKVSVYIFNIPLFIVMIVVSILFTLFHITAKGLASIPLLITFIFCMISCILVVRHKQTKGAIMMHILTNSAAVASSLGWL